MRTYLIAVVIVAALLAACNKTSSSPSSSSPSSSASSVSAKSGDAVTQKLQEVAGSGATDCGRVKSQAPDDTQKASECAMNAAKDKRAFYVAYDMPGLTIGVGGNPQGKLSMVQSDGAANATAGAKTEVKSAPCPSDLRLAPSGRVTCMPPGGGMSGPGGANPHGATPPGTGENPHGSMGAAPAGTANPHGTAQPSHPPAGQTPPKQ